MGQVLMKSGQANGMAASSAFVVFLIMSPWIMVS
jgi:hypothetical protein